MDLSTSTLIAGLLVSTVGFSLFLFGKKQTRVPQLVAGLLLMALPLLVTDALWMSGVAGAVIAALWCATRAGY